MVNITREEFIEMFKLVKDECDDNNGCDKCPMKSKITGLCLVDHLTSMGKLPLYWNFEDLE